MGAVGRALEVRAVAAVAARVATVLAVLAVAAVLAVLAVATVLAVLAVATVLAVLAVAAVPVTVVTAPVLGVLAPVTGATVRVVVAAVLVTGAMVPRTAVVAVSQVGLVEPVAARGVPMKADGRPVPEAQVVRRVAQVVRVVTGGAVVHRAPVLIIRAALGRRALRATTPPQLGRGHIPSGSRRRISRMTSRRRTSTGRRVPACGPWPRTTRTAWRATW